MNQPFPFSRHALFVIAVVKEYIDNHPLEWKKTEDLTEIAGINRNLMQKGFKYINDVTIRDYQLLKRMEVAAQLLEEGRLTQKQIASRCGYSNFNSFCKAFLKVYKMTPRKWQNNLYNK